METEVQFVWLQGASIGYLYWDSTNDEEYDESLYPVGFELKHQFMFLFFAIIITRWNDLY